VGKGQELYRKAKEIIPGGTMLLSKRPEMFLPEHWPAYYDSAKGCKVIDLDGTEYLDMCIMGIGTNILGYGHKKVDEAVLKVIDKGNMSTLNCPEEVALAQRLIDINPWSEMVRFARTGGEANSIAIRIARAASGKDKVAICGYHGWHDWYLSANLGQKDGLEGHLLPGLNPLGVPSVLEGNVKPFNYNKLEELQNIISSTPDLGVIKMEVSRNMGPEKGFLEGVRKLASKHGIVLIFDECTSGFRESFGGLHMNYGVEPDICMYGKALGNGYGITAIVGRKSVMEAAQKTFISSTFWTERIGSAAALATLDVMEKIQSWEIITSKGKEITKLWKELGLVAGLKIVTNGLPALTSFSISHPEWLKYKTYITQEMLKKNILASNSIYVSIAHDQVYIKKYFEMLEPILFTIKDCVNEKESIDNLLDGPVCHSGFKRLN
tara:strand:- start:1366 stop:2676 length:1311 start_codon:yes stop_codon:yes gene_type:complete